MITPSICFIPALGHVAPPSYIFPPVVDSSMVHLHMPLPLVPLKQNEKSTPHSSANPASAQLAPAFPNPSAPHSRQASGQVSFFPHLCTFRMELSILGMIHTYACELIISLHPNKDVLAWNAQMFITAINMMAKTANNGTGQHNRIVRRALLFSEIRIKPGKWNHAAPCKRTSWRKIDPISQRLTKLVQQLWAKPEMAASGPIMTGMAKEEIIMLSNQALCLFIPLDFHPPTGFLVPEGSWMNFQSVTISPGLS